MVAKSTNVSEQNSRSNGVRPFLFGISSLLATRFSLLLGSSLAH